LGLTQYQVSLQLLTTVETILLWEKHRATPSARYYPAIFRFLGFDPFPSPTTLPEQIASKRRILGLSIRDAAKLVGVDEGTFSRWESGEWKPRMSGDAVRHFLALRN
jgi:DNA-binding transcriptional regulator YiaG